MNITPKKSPSKLIFVGGLPLTTTNDELRRYFEQYCPLISAKIMKDRITKQSKGYALISLPDYVDTSVILLKDHIIRGRRVDCQAAAKKREKKRFKEDLKKRKLFVAGIPKGVNNEMLEAYFKQFYNVRFAYIIKDYSTNQSRRYGFVEFCTEEEARACMEGVHRLGGSPLIITNFISKEEYAKQLVSSEKNNVCARPKEQCDRHAPSGQGHKKPADTLLENPHQTDQYMEESASLEDGDFDGEKDNNYCFRVGPGMNIRYERFFLKSAGEPTIWSNDVKSGANQTKSTNPWSLFRDNQSLGLFAPGMDERSAPGGHLRVSDNRFCEKSGCRIN